jgi:M6 family metalloprotease-like protein
MNPVTRTRSSIRLALATTTIAAAVLALTAPPGQSSDGMRDGASTRPFHVRPIDPQNWENQYDMTWDDWRDIPGTQWNDPDQKPSEQGLRMALVAVDFPDQPFVITQPKQSDPFGNPQIDPIARADVPEFYRDYYLQPSELNHGRTIHEYWMEQSRGLVGVDEIDFFGPYRMPRNLFEYGVNDIGQEGEGCPEGFTCDGDLEDDADALWREDIGCDTETCGYDRVLRVYAGYDETSVWQEFGEMMFREREDVPDAWGPPDAVDPNDEMPNWVRSRYVDWTSWRAGAQLWGQSSIRQGESSGTITHEMAHTFFDIGDNNNNPFSHRQNPPQPFHRVGAAPWDMMDRGSFNGPGGHHLRWVVPPDMGGWGPAGLLLRNKLDMGIVPDRNVLDLSREALAETGLAVDRVTARAVDPGRRGTSGVRIRLDGPGRPDRTPRCDIDQDPFCHGNTGWDHYTVEVADRMGFDSFLPDHGVLLTKNKTEEGDTCGYNCFNWVIDANPQDIEMVDYYRPGNEENPGGEPVMATIADHRQLNDAAFHAGTNSGSEYEWVDRPNRLHFYVVDLDRGRHGVLSYTVAVRSLDGSGPQERDVDVDRGDADRLARGRAARCEFPLTNTGDPAETTDGHPDTDDIGAVFDSDVYRLSAQTRSRGWDAKLTNRLTTARAGQTVEVPVYVVRERGRHAGTTARVTLRATSESDPNATSTASCTVHLRDIQ